MGPAEEILRREKGNSMPSQPSSIDPTSPALTSSGKRSMEQDVLDRYERGARAPEADLCCPVTDYEADYLRILPQEIVEKDYGCGNPSRYVREGEAVVDLGSGSGKICYILAQKVGPAGLVIGIDFNDAMLALARKYEDEMARRIGYRNVWFYKARIQDMALDLEKVQMRLDDRPLRSVEDVMRFEAECDRLRRESPLVPDESVDVVVSNCVLNLVRPEDKVRLFREIHRVLRRGGRAVISDIVCDEDPTQSIQEDPSLWTGCIAGAFREDSFLAMFENAGFYGIEILARQDRPWRVIEGIEFRSVTIRAFKGKEGPCLERNQAVIYRGPWKQVRDDDGHVLHRGKRMAVCDKTFRILTDQNGPYAPSMVSVEPYEEIPLEEARPFDCKGSGFRHPKQTKGQDYTETRIDGGEACCDPEQGCC